ncbi:MAG: SDR family NAD(P)-dependent oxidoreductase, partial [Steroidobacter sp.]
MAERFSKLSSRLPRKRAFITGAGSGLGFALAKALAADGWTLGLFDRNLGRLTTVEADFTNAGVKLIAYPGDVTQSDELTVAINSFAATHDGLDLMVNNAGVAGTGSMMEVSLEDWRWIIDINVMGVVHGSRAAIPHLQRNGTGLLMNVASAAAFASAPGMISYNATKAAVLSISETLVNELRSAGIQVSVVMPTFFQSSLLETFRGPEYARSFAHKAVQRSEYSAED